MRPRRIEAYLSRCVNYKWVFGLYMAGPHGAVATPPAIPSSGGPQRIANLMTAAHCARGTATWVRNTPLTRSTVTRIGLLPLIDPLRLARAFVPGFEQF